MSSAGVTLYEYGVANTTLEKITCFVDRAEVTRCVQVAINELEVGTDFKVAVSGFPSAVIKDSVRVRCQGAAIQEVTFAETEAKEDTTQSEKASNELLKEKKDILNEISRLDAHKRRIEERRNLVMTHAEHMVSTRCQGVAPPVNDDVVALTTVLESAAKEAEHADEQMISICQQLDDQKEALAQVEEKIRRLKREGRFAGSSTGQKGTNCMVGIATISLQLEELEKVDSNKRVLYLTYLVSRSSWKPSYDVRVDRGDSGSMEVTYYGIVTNATGEDWSEVKLSLSTASPSMGSVPPLPPTLEAKWDSKKPFRTQNRMMIKKESGPPMIQMQSNMVIPAQAMMNVAEEYSDEDSVDMDEPHETVEEEAEEEEKNIPPVSVSTFEIPRLATILSDGKEHKVQVNRFDAVPIFRHFITPHLEQRAYLQARATNTSNYVLLPSDRAAVFADGAFIANTKLKRVAPGDQLDVFLGVDEDVSVEHRCLKNTTKTGRANTGLFGSKEAKTSRLVKEYVTTIHNTKTQNAVSLTLVQLLPRSTDENISVELIQPKSAPESTSLSSAASSTFGIGSTTVGAVRNKFTNNIVISAQLPPKVKKDFHFEYHVTWPFESGHVVVGAFLIK